MLRIADIMTRQVLTLAPDLSIEEAEAALTAHGFSGAPVREANGRIVGVVSRTDLLDPARRGGAGAHTVGELMTPALVTLRDSDLAMHAVRLMVREEVHRAVGVIVVDDRGELAGIVRPSDVLRALADGGADADDPDDGGPPDPPTIH